MVHGPAVTEAEFPKDAPVSERLRYLVNFAILAPSGHNTQPWLFRIDDHGLTLIADRTRALPVVDPQDLIGELEHQLAACGFCDRACRPT
mgnify:CR=1 FL=1